ncbi:AraC family transcriptional regulator [Streptomyces sp. HNM0575]|uniref:helix-turn-helix transcriptional regulator n=1 Tax=Streptomyces sp. HNM0575 TaxID=2716338 RepID=UPI00145F4349|nr:helix-turn-helix transcriptional regulator [Streptomyces sp. HNM0575]NLU75492.1 AraC family transcriptional regulator [Streptomyces sp. HNM0575]
MNAAAADENTLTATHAPTRGVFESNDLELTREFVNYAYGNDLRFRSFGEDRFFKHVRDDFGSFAMEDVRLDMDADFDVDPLPVFVVIEINSGWREHRWGDTVQRAGPGDLCANAPPHRAYCSRVHSPDFRSVVLSQSLLARTGGFTEDQPGRALRFTGTQPASPGLADQWRTTAAHVRDLLGAGSDALKEPLVTANLARHLAQSALNTFPNTGGPQLTSADGADATPGAVRRGIAFMEEYAHTDIGLAEIATAARVSTPALQIAFARHHSTTPFGHLRAVRLDRAHFDLLACKDDEETGAARDPATVASVAARWGYASTADFTASYRHAYGVSPDETLAA